MATKKVNIDIIAKDKSRRALGQVRSRLDRIKKSAFSVKGALAGIGAALISVPMATAISGLEIIVVLVQAYVFTLLTAVFIGMAINVHH